MMKACLTVGARALGGINLRDSLNIGVRVAIPMEDGAILSSHKALFEVLTPYFGLKPSDYDRIFKTAGDRHRIAVINPNRPEYPNSTERVVDGRGFTISAENVPMYPQNMGV